MGNSAGDLTIDTSSDQMYVTTDGTGFIQLDNTAIDNDFLSGHPMVDDVDSLKFEIKILKLMAFSSAQDDAPEEKIKKYSICKKLCMLYKSSNDDDQFELDKVLYMTYLKLTDNEIDFILNND